MVAGGVAGVVAEIAVADKMVLRWICDIVSPAEVAVIIWVLSYGDVAYRKVIGHVSIVVETGRESLNLIGDRKPGALIRRRGHYRVKDNTYNWQNGSRDE